MKKIIFFLFLGYSILGCKSDKKPANQTTNVTQAKKISVLPPLPEAHMKIIWEKCDYLDYLFYNTNFTLSQDNQASIQQFVTFLSNEHATTRKECKSLGRVFFQEKGEIMYEAEFYFEKGCTYLEFLVDNKPKWHNELTPKGIQFFMNLFKKAQSGEY